MKILSHKIKTTASSIVLNEAVVFIILAHVSSTPVNFTLTVKNAITNIL